MIEGKILKSEKTIAIQSRYLLVAINCFARNLLWLCGIAEAMMRVRRAKTIFWYKSGQPRACG